MLSKSSRDIEIISNKDGEFVAEFTVGDQVYGFFASNNMPIPSWDFGSEPKNYKYINTREIVFIEGEVVGRNGWSPRRAKTPIGITGSGNHFVVFTSVAIVLFKFIKLNNPVSFAFSAKEPSRIKVYKLLSKRIQSTFGWPYKIYENSVRGTTYFFFWRGKAQAGEIGAKKA